MVTGCSKFAEISTALTDSPVIWSARAAKRAAWPSPVGDRNAPITVHGAPTGSASGEAAVTLKPVTMPYSLCRLASGRQRQSG